ncbi:MAG: T9SS type A sorting domain-containing protein [Bacteroidetes bacterium]|nr:T9SS type A sorting domain-containing protein [Bacteroidota bacterium]
MIKFTRLLSLFFPFFIQAQNVHYVHSDATGANNGTSWTNAFTNLKTALQSAQAGDQIWVASGTYRTTNQTDRNLYFELKSGVQLYGGFKGVESALSQRNWEQNPSIIDGDIGQPNDSTDNAYNLFRLLNPDANTRIDGFWFQNALSNKTNSLELGGSGAALFIDGSTTANALIQNCIFSHNTALNAGGAIFIKAGNNSNIGVRIRNCVFEFNHADNGGAVYRQGSAMSGPNDDFQDCRFYRNTAGSYGSAIYFSDAMGRTDTLDVRYCVFEQNQAQLGYTLPSGAFFTAGRNTGSCLRFVGDEFIQNSSKSGSGIVFYSEDYPLKYLLVDSCRFDSNYSYQWNSSVSGLAISVFSGYYDFGVFKSRYDILHNTFLHHNGPIIELAMLSRNTLMLVENDFIQNYNYYIDSGGGFQLLSDTIYALRNRFYQNQFPPRFNMTANSYGLVQGNICKKAYITLNMNNKSALFFNNVYDGGNEVNTFVLNNKNIYYGNLVINNRFTLKVDPFLVPKKQSFINNIFINNRNTIVTPDTRFYQYLPFYVDSAYFAYNLFDFDSKDSLGQKSYFGPGNLFGQDPMIRDTAAGDYQLLPCSPAFDAGLNMPYQQYGILEDIFGHVRISDARADIGPSEGQPLKLEAAPLIQAACTDTTGEVNFPLANGCPPYLFQWTSGGKIGSGNTKLDAGTYQFTITDSKGRIVYAYAVIDGGHPPTVTPTIVPATCGSCTNGRINLSVSGSSAYKYQWSNGATSRDMTMGQGGEYTVTITDANGCTYTFTFTVPIVSAAENQDGNAPRITLAPVPARTALHVSWENIAVENLSLIDVLGKEQVFVWIPEGQNNAQLDVNQLPAGWYFLRARTRTQQILTRKVLVR